MLGPAQQHQVGQVGGAAIQPVPQMLGLTPGQRPLAVRNHAAAVADGQGVALAGGDDPGGAAQVQGLAGGATQDRGQQGHGRPQLGSQPSAILAVGVVAGMVVAVEILTLGIVAVVAARLVGAGGLAADQDPGHGPVTGQPPAGLGTQGPAQPVSPPKEP
jgi:hypothetical protein